MQNYEIKINKKELDVILMALNDSKDLLEEQYHTINRSYWNLPVNEKLFWRNKSAYDKYKDTFSKDCCKQSEDVYKLEEKLKEILEKQN